MTRHLLRRLSGAGLFIVGGLVTWAVVRLSFEPLFVAGTTAPATIYGPAIGAGAVVAGAMLLLAIACGVTGRWRILALLAWLLFLASTTHRLVEHDDGGVADVWLGMRLRTLVGDAAQESVAPRCTVGRWSAYCRGSGGGHLFVPTPWPLSPLSPGLWEKG